MEYLNSWNPIIAAFDCLQKNKNLIWEKRILINQSDFQNFIRDHFRSCFPVAIEIPNIIAAYLNWICFVARFWLSIG